MKALVYKSPGKVALEEVAKPLIQEPRDVIVRVTTAAICGSDLHCLHGLGGLDPGTVMGHEYCGTVEQAGSGVSWLFKPGDRVLGAPQTACGNCYFCIRNMPAGCKEAAVFGGGPMFGDLPGVQAEYVRVPLADFTLRHIPDGLEDEDVIFTGDILSTALMGVDGMKAAETVAILGTGPVGLMSVALSKLYGAGRIIAIDPLQYRLEKAMEMGADIVVNSDRQDPVDAVYSATGENGADLVIEAVGKPETFLTGMALARPGGTYSVLGIIADSFELPNFALMKNLYIKTGLGNPCQMDRLLTLIKNRKLDLRPVITHRILMDQSVEAYKMFDAKEDNAIKIMLLNK